MPLKHKHLIISLSVKWPPKDHEEVKAFQSFLIKRVGMKIAKADSILENPIAYYCETPGNMGVTGVGILETSHTAIHVWEEEYPAKMEFDLYSCSEFDIEHVVGMMMTFGILSGNFYVLDRDSRLVIIDSGTIDQDGNINRTNETVVNKES